MPQTSISQYIPGESASLAVSNSVLRVLAGASWLSGTCTNSTSDRIIRLVNCDTAEPLYASIVATKGERTGVSATDYDYRIAVNTGENIYVPAGYDLVVIKANSSTLKAKAWEFLFR